MPTITEAMEIAREFTARGELPQAAQIYRTILEKKPSHALAWHQLGIVEVHRGHSEEGITSLRRSVELAPGQWLLHNSLGAALERAGKLDEAAESFSEAMRLNPEAAVVHFNLGAVLQRQRKNNKALAAYQRATALNPGYAEAFLNMGVLFKDSGHLESAKQALANVIRLKPHLAGAHVDLGAVFQAEENFDAALECYRTAQVHDPQNAGAIAGEVFILDLKGELKPAFEKLEPLAAAGTLSPEAAVVYANLSRHFDRREQALALLDRFAKKSLPAPSKIPVLFAAARLADSLAQFDAAFEYAGEANRLARPDYDVAQFERLVESMISTFTPKFLASHPRAGNASARPVFIVGMSRSGTSLVEQILASHPSCFGAGELPTVGQISDALPAVLHTETPYPECVAEMSQEALDNMARKFLETLDEVSPDAERVTDKMPGNCLHLGLIELLFPKARIIHCRRHPLDTCVSCYLQGFNKGHGYTYDFTTLGAVYQGYERLMEHWRSVIQLPMFEINYEDLVADQEGMSRKLIDFCGLDWDENCLRFFETNRTVRTASYDQVRQPLYQRSVERYRNYEKYLGPLKAALHWEERPAKLRRKKTAEFGR